jgi:hypothetical protein
MYRRKIGLFSCLYDDVLERHVVERSAWRRKHADDFADLSRPVV